MEASREVIKANLCSQDHPYSETPKCAQCGTGSNLIQCSCKAAWFCSTEHWIVFCRNGHEAVCNLSTAYGAKSTMLSDVLHKFYDATGLQQLRNQVAPDVDNRPTSLLYLTMLEQADLTLLINTGQAAQEALKIFKTLWAMRDLERPDFPGRRKCDLESEILILFNRVGLEVDSWNKTTELVQVGLEESHDDDTRLEVHKALEKRPNVMENFLVTVKAYGLNTERVNIRWVINLLLLKIKTLTSMQNIQNTRLLYNPRNNGLGNVPVIPNEMVQAIQWENASPLVRDNSQIASKIRNGESLEEYINELHAQSMDMVRMIDNSNPFFWAVFRYPGESIRSQVDLNVVRSRRSGKREAQLAIQRLYVTFLEAPGAMEWLDQNLFGRLLSDDECQRRLHPNGDGFNILEWH